MSAMPTCEQIYAEAINLLEERGWTQGHWGDENGICLVSAVRCATIRLGGERGYYPEYSRLRDRAFVDLGLGDLMGACRWNDAPGRSYAEVVGLLAERAGVDVPCPVPVELVVSR